jgi:hypothetical protein
LTIAKRTLVTGTQKLEIDDDWQRVLLGKNRLDREKIRKESSEVVYDCDLRQWQFAAQIIDDERCSLGLRRPMSRAAHVAVYAVHVHPVYSLA